MEHSTEILYNRTRVYCSAVHRFGSDALLLARFSEPKRAWRAADLCSGCGIVSLEWHDRGHRGPCLGLELQPEASALLAAACVTCHGPGGRGAGSIPGLRGRGSAFLLARMQAFQSGPVAGATVMPLLMQGYDTAQMQALAQWFARPQDARP